ncbi:KilA-N domain-containing protein [Bacteroides cellulosilyticus]|mgnify:CR=1 FL=1|uniref:KilA-N domain-containing protein n=1 Tax=Bacteroides cellulosilyticus TaxID=246787 RepID=UPI0035690864
MAELRILDFNGTRVSFVVGGRTVLVCVSELSRAFGRARQPSRWLATRQAKEIVRQVSGKRRIRMESLVIVRRGGVINGTWMYAEVAVAYAEWLSPEIGKNCNEGIKEIIGVKTSK